MTQWPSGLGQAPLIPPRPDALGMSLPSIPRMREGWNMAAIINPPPASAGTTPYSAAVNAPKSIAEVVYIGTPVSNVTDLVHELQDRRPRPVVPDGWRERWETILGRMPENARARFVAARRFATSRVNSNVKMPLRRE